MEAELTNEIIDCLPKGKTHYRYYKNGYAPKILSMVLDRKTSVRAVNKTSFAKLLNNPAVKAALANCGDGLINPKVLSLLWQEPSFPFLLTASKWQYASRGWSQVSRHGDNLVLQLNMPKINESLFERYIGADYIFNPSTDHPVQCKTNNSSFRETLAWSRIDLDFDTNEALIEEIQSDAVRVMHRRRRFVGRCLCRMCTYRKKYLDWFENYASAWQETMLMATIDFIRNELGISRIFMHTDRSGWRVKRINKNYRPPRSLYSTLPKKFAFNRVWNGPAFLIHTRSYQQLVRKQPDIDFYLLDFSRGIS